MGMKSPIGAIAIVTLLMASGAGAATGTNNNDSCDISVAPAATLLLPYFEVDVTQPPGRARTTLFTVVNTSANPTIARVTVWTDYAYPVLTFNLALTGYDAQSINLYDVLGPQGMTLPGAAWCGFLPSPVSQAISEEIRSALTAGTISSCGDMHVGNTHKAAAGYVTIDVARSCAHVLPVNPAYWDDLLDDNVLIGDWQMLNPDPVNGNYASGSPLVHIRAIQSTKLPYTFYDRFTSTDHRQPLPSRFAARFIQGGTGAFNTNFLIWREGLLGSEAVCKDYIRNSHFQNYLRIGQRPELVRFDEHENPTITSSTVRIPEIQLYQERLPAASSNTSDGGLFPPMSQSGDVGGWLYLDLNDDGTTIHGKSRPAQNWVVVSMYADGRFSFAFDAAPLANGCTTKP